VARRQKWFLFFQIACFIKPIEAACFDPNRKSGRTGVLVNLIPYNPIYNQLSDGEPLASDEPTGAISNVCVNIYMFFFSFSFLLFFCFDPVQSDL